MKPYYEHGGITIYHGDCREILPGVSADLLITDPPYGISYRSDFRKDTFESITGDDDADKIVPLLDVAVRRLDFGRHVYIFGPLDVSALPLGGRTELIWDKDIIGMGNLSSPWGTSHERITFGVYFPSRQNRKDGRGNGAARLRRGSVLRFQRLHTRQNSLHPTEKPVLLLRELIESSSHIGECVLDPFCGSGSTLVAAAQECRRAVGIEIEERYCEVAARRLHQSEEIQAHREEASRPMRTIWHRTSDCDDCAQ